jgi:hypothetical protein
MAISNTNTGWVNSDTLRVKFPAEEVVKGKGGEWRENTSIHATEFDLDFATINLGTSDTAPYVLDFDTVLPAGAIVEEIWVRTGITAWASAGDGAKLNVGLVKRSDFATIVDADGLVNSLAETEIDTIGAIHKIYLEDNATGAGALLGTVLAFDSVVCVYLETEAWTAGTGSLVLYWRMVAE